MRALLQRVQSASVVAEGEVLASVQGGLLVFLGLHRDDTNDDADRLIRKILNARIFGDAAGFFSRSVRDVSGELLVVSQITLYGDMTQGNRPDFSNSMEPAKAVGLYEEFISRLRGASGLRVEQGKFGAVMEVKLVNAGPVTVLVDSGR